MMRMVEAIDLQSKQDEKGDGAENMYGSDRLLLPYWQEGHEQMR